VNANEKRGGALRVVLVDVLKESLLLAIGEKANAPIFLRLLLDFGGRVEGNSLILDSDSEDEGNGSLPAIEAGSIPFSLVSEVQQKTQKLLLADTLRRPIAELLAEGLEPESVAIRRFSAVLRPADFDRVIEQFFERDRSLAKVLWKLFPLELFCLPLGEESDRVGSASNLFPTAIPVDVELLDIEDSRVPGVFQRCRGVFSHCVPYSGSSPQTLPLVRMRSRWSARAKRLMSPAGMRIFLPIVRVVAFPSAMR